MRPRYPSGPANDVTSLECRVGVSSWSVELECRVGVSSWSVEESELSPKWDTAFLGVIFRPGSGDQGRRPCGRYRSGRVRSGLAADHTHSVDPFVDGFVGQGRGVPFHGAADGDPGVDLTGAVAGFHEFLSLIHI